MKCSVCGIPARTLTGNALGCPVHGIRRLEYEDHEIALWQRAAEIEAQYPGIGMARALKSVTQEKAKQS